MYRFDNGQWKERGIGEMKIMKHISQCKLSAVSCRTKELWRFCNRCSDGVVCCSESFPFYSHLILTRREGFFPLSTPSSSYLCVCVLPHLCAVLFRVLLLPPEGSFFSLSTPPSSYLYVCFLPPVCSAVPSAAASTRRHFFPFPPRRLLTCRCSSTCVQCGSECCCILQKAFFPLSTPSSSYL